MLVTPPAGALTAHNSVAGHTLLDLCNTGAAVSPDGDDEALPTLLLFDTAGCGMEELVEEEGDSKANPGEAAAVMAHVGALIRAGIAPQDIGIITPYNAQVGCSGLARLGAAWAGNAPHLGSSFQVHTTRGHRARVWAPVQWMSPLRYGWFTSHLQR